MDITKMIKKLHKLASEIDEFTGTVTRLDIDKENYRFTVTVSTTSDQLHQQTDSYFIKKEKFDDYLKIRIKKFEITKKLIERGLGLDDDRKGFYRQNPNLADLVMQYNILTVRAVDMYRKPPMTIKG